MKLFIFQYVSHVSPNYHDGGGLAIIAHTRESAQALADRTEHVELDEFAWTDVNEFDGVMTNEERIYIFPDAGCC